MASSMVCSWLMAACMSVACENDSSNTISMLSSNPSFSSRFSKWAARKRKRAAFPISSNSKYAPEFSTIRNLMSSCLSFEPCHNFSKNTSTNSSSLALSCSSFFSGDNNGRIHLGPSSRRNKLNHTTHSGKVVAIAVQPAKEIAAKKKHYTKQRRVVVTGMGVETPIGHDPDAFYSNLLEGVSGISKIEAFDCSHFPTRIAGEIKSFTTDGWVAPKLSKRMDKFMLYMLTAGKKALEDGGITEDIMDELDKTRCGVLIGSAMGGMKVFNDAIEALRISYRKMNPFCVPFATTNMGSAMLAMDLGWMGPNYSISTACATSNFCILNAANHIIRGEADMMLCGGSDAAIIPIGLGGFVACRALSQRNNDPSKASCPWDSNRDGFVMGEGAGVLLLEELEHAEKRGANIYAEFLGGSFTCDAYHMTEPHPQGTGVILCIEKALAQSGVPREDVNYINAHATSTPAGDLKEYQALVHCFGQNRELRVNSTKSMIGHLLGAAGAVEAVATVQAIRTGWIHPNINLEHPDDGVDVSVLVGPKKEQLDIKVALSNSFGFGGHNSSILFAPNK
ncbi:hypothetical protein ACH5RR_006253 [Cinchona calisaya]|uniref:beta-ketoacyl-[acyl-carrier-protein] synthase I n=1 Tax=Cinchona calisaya TaxID=153742 RepID=A0ABD3ANG5_9GENT